MFVRSLIAAGLCCCAVMAGQTSVAPSPYDVDDAYQIYSLLLADEESYGFAKDTLVIQEATVLDPVSESCLTPAAATRFKAAIADYKLANGQPWLLQRQFQIEKPYEIVNTDTIEALFKDGGWDSFYKRFPGSGGLIIMSAVGFNKEKTQAIVYTGSSCGILCGLSRFHLLESLTANGRQYLALGASPRRSYQLRDENCSPTKLHFVRATRKRNIIVGSPWNSPKSNLTIT